MLNYATNHTDNFINKLRKTLQFIFILFGLTTCQAQEVDGIWMSYKNYIIDINSMYTSGDEGVIIDFNKQTFGTIRTDSIIPIKLDFKHSKLYLKNDTLNVDFKIYAKDSVEIDFGTNMMHVFRPLNLNHKLPVDKSQICDFLINNDFDKINRSIDFDFSNKIFFRDEISGTPNHRNALINKSWNEEGYWYIKEIEQNYFLIFTLDQISGQNIYQILSINECKMELVQIQEPEFGNVKITELKICL